MKRNIITELLGNISPKFITNTAQTFQEKESGVSEGLKNLVPTIFYQLHHKMESGHANELFQFLKDKKQITGTNQLDGIPLERKNIVNDFIKKLFGNQQKSVLDFISQRNHLRFNSSEALMTIGGTLVIEYLGKLIRGEGLTLSSFNQLLAVQQEEIKSALPIGITKWLGNIRPLATASNSTGNHQVAAAGTTRVAYASTGSAASDTAVAAASGSSSMGWAKWLLVIPFLLLGLWYFLGQGSSTDTSTTVADAKVPTVTQPAPTIVKPTETEDALIEATKEIAQKETKETSVTDNKVSKYNNTISVVKPNRKEEQLVTIHPPVSVEEPVVEASTSPGGSVYSSEFSNKGQNSNNNSSTSIVKKSIDNDLGSGSYSSVASESRKISYEDYSEQVKMPARAITVANSIKKETTTSRPDWYTESKKVVDGNSGNVSIIKITETVLESRNTSQLAMLRKSLPLEKYNAWFGFITNPISSTEYRLYSYLNETSSSGKAIDQYTWFNLDEVKFKSLSSRMDYEKSKGQLTRIANILSANPDVQLKIGGFTSDKGRKKANRKLSLEMAEQAKAALTKLGVDESRITVKGYGESHPLGLNDTEEGRMKNHRVGFRVISK